MTKFILFLLALFVATVAVADTRAERQARQERIFQIEERIRATRPRNRLTPARAENISDEEVREVKAVVAQVLAKAIVNISTVVTGCECEDGPFCTEQVWVITYGSVAGQGLLLSRIAHRWKIGPVQQWWLDYERAGTKRYRTSKELDDAEDALTEAFPACLGKPDKPLQ